ALRVARSPYFAQSAFAKGRHDFVTAKLGADSNVHRAANSIGKEKHGHGDSRREHRETRRTRYDLRPSTAFPHYIPAVTWKRGYSIEITYGSYNGRLGLIMVRHI